MNADIQLLEEHRDELKKQVELNEAIVRLMKNRDFRKVILDAYMVADCARLAHTSCDPILSVQERADALSMAQAAGHLKRWLAVQGRMAENAERGIADVNQTLDELRAEGVE